MTLPETVFCRQAPRLRPRLRQLLLSGRFFTWRSHVNFASHIAARPLPGGHARRAHAFRQSDQHVSPGVPVFEKILRPIVVYFFIVVGFRLAGKRELAQLNPFRPDRASDDLQHGSERHHRRRQFCYRRTGWRIHSAADQLSFRAFPLFASKDRRAPGRRSGRFDQQRKDCQRRLQKNLITEGGAVSGGTPPRIRQPQRGG